MALKNNTWKLNQWYDQSVAGNATYSGLSELWVVGQASEGVLGLNTHNVHRSSPVQLTGSWKYSLLNQSSDGENGGIKTDGTLWTWGRNEKGEMGVNDTTFRSSPVQVGSGTDWAIGRMRGRQEGGIATKTDGTLWVWGVNNKGGLGQNNTTQRSSPVQVPGTTWPTSDPKYLTTCSENVCMVIKTDGTLWAWGANNYGHLGQNQPNNSHVSSPVQIGSETTWSLASGGDATVAIKTDGTLWVWGSNNRGQLGLNQNPGQYGGSYAKSSPTQLGSETTWSQASSGTKSMGGVKTDGTLWIWGQNDHGRLGQNQDHPGLDGASSPVQVPGTNWQELSVGDDWTLAMKTDGTLWGWGDNYRGHLGQNNQVKYSSPVQIPGTDWVTGFRAGNKQATFMKNV